MLSRFHLIPERYGQTDRRTELLYEYRASVLRAESKTRSPKLIERMHDSYYRSILTLSVSSAVSFPTYSYLSVQNREIYVRQVFFAIKLFSEEIFL